MMQSGWCNPMHTYLEVSFTELNKTYFRVDMHKTATTVSLFQFLFSESFPSGFRMKTLLLSRKQRASNPVIPQHYRRIQPFTFFPVPLPARDSISMNPSACLLPCASRAVFMQRVHQCTIAHRTDRDWRLNFPPFKCAFFSLGCFSHLKHCCMHFWG